MGRGDLSYPQTGHRSANASFRNKIDRKHVDFVLCDPHTMRPLVGIELDDATHGRVSRQARDEFVDEVLAAAGLFLERPIAIAVVPVIEVPVIVLFFYLRF